MERMYSLHKLDRILIGVGLLLFGLLYAAYSFPNHYFFRTLNTDLGYFSHALFDYSQFRWASVGKFDNILWDHVSAYPMLLAPLRWLFGSWTLLVVQVVALMLGGLGVARFVQTRSALAGIPALAAWTFWLSFSIFPALSHDYHNTVVGACLIPWLFVAFSQGQFRKAAVWVVLLILCKETFALFTAFIGLGLAWEYRTDRARWVRALAYSAAGFIWFGICLWGIIPFFAPEGKGLRHFTYSSLGNNFGEAIIYLFQYPKFSFQFLFRNTTDFPELDSLKIATWIVLLLTGGWAMFRKPQYGVMVVPILAAKFWSDKPEHWSLAYHYSIEFAPLLPLAVFAVLSEVKKPVPALSLGILVLLLGLGATLWTHECQHERYLPKKEKVVYRAEHWTRNYPVATFHRELKKIPPHASVAAHNRLFAHLCMRKEAWPFPENLKEVEYVALLKDHPSWPLTPSEYEAQLEAFKADSLTWEVITEVDALLILHRRDSL